MFSGAALQILNHLLDQAPGAHARLARHAGAQARLELGQLGVAFTIGDDGRLCAASGESLTLTLRLPADAALRLPHEGDTVLRDARIEGDAALAETLGQVLRGLRWDAAEDLSRLIGDAAAERVVGGVRSALAGGRDLGARFAMSAGEYVADEVQLLVRPAATAAFSDEVDILRDDLARLQKRVELLARKAQAGR